MKIIDQATLPEETVERLRYLTTLEDNWMNNEEGDPVSEEAITFAVCFLEEWAKRTTKPRPGIYPLVEGGIFLEWDDDDRNTPGKSIGDTDSSWSIELLNSRSIIFVMFAKEWNDHFQSYIDKDEEIWTHYDNDETMMNVISTLLDKIAQGWVQKEDR